MLSLQCGSAALAYAKCRFQNNGFFDRGPDSDRTDLFRLDGLELSNETRLNRQAHAIHCIAWACLVSQVHFEVWLRQFCSLLTVGERGVDSYVEIDNWCHLWAFRFRGVNLHVKIDVWSHLRLSRLDSLRDERNCGGDLCFFFCQN